MKIHIWAVEVFDGELWSHWSIADSRAEARFLAGTCRPYFPRVRVVKLVRATP